MNPENGGTPPAGSASNAPAASQPNAPTNGTPPAGDPAQNPTGQPMTLEEALAASAKWESEAKSARKEAANYRTKAQELDTIKQQQAQANLTEIEREKQARTQAEQKAEQLTAKYRATVIEGAAKQLGIVDPVLAASLVAASPDLELDGDGMPTNADKVLKALIQAKPYLAPAPTTGPANAPAGGNPSLPTFKESQLADYSFYTKNKAAIEQAMRDGRIVRDMTGQ